ncbi:hypothetical protein Poli38472_010032 [Pythium oligandrum]|uniref:Uncharacterized protein n=1 Tax=Pythium oligandrum TaxID=41045 RepID=A0A8K1C8Q1_PYTOL|nr:hypothetical protein Poli38472_010032 [Pythium oligandrum]|eukprot:TMW58473.1 hypothetical protein Poli38472_010032 [Pythium oligandrum]
MAGWFGHTQTITSISKSVTTVASGILGLEANLATFMQKVIYYDKFFQRMRGNLPPVVVDTAFRLIARCYEYRDEIRDELESSLAYVADAGRWVIGLEDWNSKMEKRLVQMNELVVLSNTLLVEFAITGHWGAADAKQELSAYVKTISESVVLRNLEEKRAHDVNKTTVPPVSVPEAPQRAQPVVVSGTTQAKDTQQVPSRDAELVLSRSSSDEHASSSLVEEPTATLSVSTTLSVQVEVPTAQDDEDDDLLNPFAQAYQPPMSVESSLASLRGESDNGSLYMSATDSLPRRPSSPLASATEDVEEPDSPVSLGEYECLEIDSIPQYVAFKPSTLSRKRRLKERQQVLSPTNGSAGSSTRSSPRASPRSNKSAVSAEKNGNDRARQRLIDLTVSYDFQRELEYNPFASPSMQPASQGTNAPHPPPASPLDLPKQVMNRVPTVQEDEMLTLSESDHSAGSSEEYEEPRLTESQEVSERVG